MVTITETAAQKIKEEFKSQNKENAFLRLYLTEVNCGGPSFGLALDETKTDADFLEQENGVAIIANRILMPHLEGAVVDYIDSAEGEGFAVSTIQVGFGCGGCTGGC